MGYKIITMKRQLLLYLIKLFVGIVIIIICWLALTNIFVECGVIIPANYSETILEENRKRLDDIQQITDNDLPYGSKYSMQDIFSVLKIGVYDYIETIDDLEKYQKKIQDIILWDWYLKKYKGG